VRVLRLPLRTLLALLALLLGTKVLFPVLNLVAKAIFVLGMPLVTLALLFGKATEP
jgi:hypothetical protein